MHGCLLRLNRRSHLFCLRQKGQVQPLVRKHCAFAGGGLCFDGITGKRASLQHSAVVNWRSDSAASLLLACFFLARDGGRLSDCEGRWRFIEDKRGLRWKPIDTSQCIARPVRSRRMGRQYHQRFTKYLLILASFPDDQGNKISIRLGLGRQCDRVDF